MKQQKILRGLKIFNKNLALNKTFHIVTLGCKINIYESESIVSGLQNESFVINNKRNNSDIVIINTCTVTIKADAKCRQLIRKSRKENPDCLLIVCGCLVDTNRDDLLKMKEIDILIKNNDKDKISGIIFDCFQGKINNRPYFFNTKMDGAFNYKNIKMSRHSRAFLKVQDGCDNYCSFCKIPFARGKSRSRDVNDILNEINLFIKNGYEEVVLTGINLGGYKFNNCDFASLINSLSNNFPEIRFRLSSVEPQYINTDFLKSFAIKNICPHIHIPLQSGSDKILKLMNRKYNIGEYFEKINLIRRIKDDTFISTDLIIGFPGETDEDFLKTIDFIKKINFSFIHLFSYSPREETLSNKIKEKVCERIINERMEKVKSMVDELNYDYRKKFVNKKLEILIEGEKKGYYTGKSENYINLLVDKKIKLMTKKRYNVIFTKIKDNINYCKLI